jgi:hypothetical protein
MARELAQLATKTAGGLSAVNVLRGLRERERESRTIKVVTGPQLSARDRRGRELPLLLRG